MESKNIFQKKKFSKRNWICSLLIIVSALFIVWPFITWGILYVVDWLFDGIDFPDASRFGISGDMYGALNALFAGFAFICFIYALYQQRLELQLQRRELSLQRRELKAQCREQERQANEFEAQNNLMKFQQFESFFYNYFNHLRFIREDVKRINLTGKKLIYFCLNKLSNIYYQVDYRIDEFKVNKTLNLSSLEVSLQGEIRNFKYHIIAILPWVNTVYNFFKMILNNKDIDISLKTKYITIVIDSFSDYELMMIHSCGLFLKYDDLVCILENEKFFHENEMIDNIKENREVWCSLLNLSPNFHIQKEKINYL